MSMDVGEYKEYLKEAIEIIKSLNACDK
ncbi:Hypothetical protein CFV354_0037 [Campylobacter fetus subsp. venerealis NCTC 10354]|nr:Hypothetical protein CFV354_0037 [Campylobacter fetus subsp. venerealis NCTC 10354]